MTGYPNPKNWCRNPGKPQIFEGTQGAPRVPFPQLYMMKGSATPGQPRRVRELVTNTPNNFQEEID